MESGQQLGTVGHHWCPIKDKYVSCWLKVAATWNIYFLSFIHDNVLGLLHIKALHGLLNNVSDLTAEPSDLFVSEWLQVVKKVY